MGKMSHGKLLRFLTLLACGPLVPAWAVQPGHYLNRCWQTAEGMPSNVVSGIARDADGFLWIGTGAGVARFDGMRFELHSLEQGLPDTEVRSLHLDRAGRIWAGTRHGVAVRENGKWRIPPDLPQEAVFSIGESQDGSIWIGTYNGCWRWSRGAATRIDFGEIRPDTRGFLDDGYGGLWILTAGHLCRWDPEVPGVARSVPGPWNGYDLRGLTRDRTGRMVICGTGLLLREEKTGGWENLADEMPGGSASNNLACLGTPDGSLWVATRDRGLQCLDDNGWSTIDSGKGYISLDDTRSLLFDEDGMLWVGTNGGGLNLLRRRLFDSYSTGEGLGRTVTSSLVIGSRGEVWAGTDGGGIFKYENDSFVPAFTALRMPKDGLIWSLCAGRDGSLWAGTYRDGLLRIHEGTLGPVTLDGTPLTASISALFETRRGGLLIGTRGGGVWCWNDGEARFAEEGPTGTETNVQDILEDREGNIWVACGSQGLWRRTGDRWGRAGENPGESALNPGALLEAADGGMWVGTLGQGLVRIRNGRIDRWTVDQGLASNIVVQMLEDSGRNLWIGTDNGLQRLSHEELEGPLEGRFTGIRLGREDGLPTPQFSGAHGNLCDRAADGTLWFSLASGAIHVDPRKFSKPPRPAVVQLESATTDHGQIWEREGPLEAEKIVVTPGAGTLRIRLASPEFVAPERIRFRYRMTGLENEWQEIDGGRVASYASLPPGSYRFDLSVIGRNGAASSQPASIPVEVQPFFWQTLAFRLATGGTVLVVLGFAVRAWSLRRLRKRMALLYQEQRVERERARIASELHDDLGASLTEVNFLGTLAAASSSDGALRQRLDGIVERVQRMAKSLDEIVWAVNPANDTLASTANYLCSRTQESLGAAGIRSRLSVDEALPDMVLDSDLRHQLLLAVNESVNNVMKHSGSTECHLAISVRDGTLAITIEDFGRGFDPASESDGGNGHVNLSHRMEAVGGSCCISSTPGAGTRVHLTIPLPQPSA